MPSSRLSPNQQLQSLQNVASTRAISLRPTGGQRAEDSSAPRQDEALVRPPLTKRFWQLFAKNPKPAHPDLGLPKRPTQATPSPFQPPAYLCSSHTDQILVDPMLSYADGLSYERAGLSDSQKRIGVIPNHLLRTLCQLWTEYRVEAASTVTSRLSAALMCPISQDTLALPYCARDGHTYELAGLKQWLQHSATSPITREPLTNGFVWRNRHIEQALLELAPVSQEPLTKHPMAPVQQPVALQTLPACAEPNARAQNTPLFLIEDQQARTAILHNEITMQFMG